MSFTEKARTKAEQLAGAAKERIGDATNNEPMRGDGASQQRNARTKQNVTEAGSKIKDAFNK
ncbi:CsbD family protein [Micromonospora sp. GCM10011542]|uniref:CsbD family protein n=1 Tax=Micromonospora sp. GCM10011542 TaxID=3317337 RepID=UPI00361F08D2